MSAPHVNARNGMVQLDLAQAGVPVAGQNMTPAQARQLAVDLIVAAYQAELDRIRAQAGKGQASWDELIDEARGALNAPGTGAAALDAYLASTTKPYHGPRGIVAAVNHALRERTITRFVDQTVGDINGPGPVGLLPGFEGPPTAAELNRFKEERLGVWPEEGSSR
jgi:hypothetical protein